MKRGWIVLTAVISAMALLMTACGGGAADSSSGEIKIGAALSSPAEKKILENQLKEFEKENPGIKVKIHSITDDYMKEMQTLIGAKKEPDVFYLDSMPAPDLINLQVLEPLDSYLDKNKVDLKEFEESLVKAYQKDGKTYGIPKDYNNLALFYNKEMFKKAGLNPPTTWDEFRAAAKKLSKGGNKGLAIHPELARFQPFLYQNGGQVMDDKGKASLNTPQNVEALQFFKDLFEDGSTDTPANLGVDWAGDAFAEGKAAMVLEGGWLIPFLKEKAPDLDYGMVELPVKEKGKPNSNLAFTVAYVMSKNSKNKDASFKLIQFLTSEKGQQAVVDSGLALPSRKAMGEKVIEKYPEREVFVKGAAYAEPFQYGDYGNKLVDPANQAAESVVLKREKSVKAALDKAQKKANQ